MIFANPADPFIAQVAPYISHLASMTGMSSPRRWRPPDWMREELLRLAGYQCAICRRNLRKFDKVSEKTKDIADAAHIYPHSDRGERGDPGHRPALVDDISNLIMLCPSCHRLVDWDGVGGRIFTVDKLRAIRCEQEAWVRFRASRVKARQELAAAGQPGLASAERGQSFSVDGQAYRLPWEERPDRVDTTFSQEWSPEHDAVRCQSYAYAETGAARHAWLRRVDALDDSETGERWRRELAHEASLLKAQLPQLPGLPPVLGINPLASEPFALVTGLPSTVSMLNRYGAAGASATTLMAEESVRALFAGLPALCTALGALHDAGLAHGALDPRAILVDQRGDLVLRDLGHATIEPADSTQAGTGEPGRPGKHAKDNDVRCLAAIVYELVTGVPPLSGADGPPVPASAHNPAVSDQVTAALTQALTGDIRDARALARCLRSPRPHRSRPRTAPARNLPEPRKEPGTR
jgi:HNH endonuclease